MPRERPDPPENRSKIDLDPGTAPPELPKVDLEDKPVPQDRQLKDQGDKLARDSPVTPKPRPGDA